MLFLGLEEGIRNADSPRVIHIKVGGTLLKRSTQIAAPDFQHAQRIGINIAGNNIPDGHIPGKAPALIGKGCAGYIRTGCPQLDPIEKVCDFRSVKSGLKAVSRPQIFGEVPDRTVEEMFKVLTDRFLLFCPCLPLRRCQKTGGERTVLRHLNAHIFFRIAWRLHHMGAMPAFPGKRNMLMPGQKQVDGQLFADAAGFVFIGLRQHSACLKVFFHTAVINADNLVTACRLKGPDCFPGRRHRRRDAEGLQIFLLLPDIDPVRHNAEQTDLQPAGHGPDFPFPDGQLARQIFHIGAQTHRMQAAEIFSHPGRSVIEIMIAQRDIIIASGVHGIRHDLPAVLFMQEVGQRRPLNGVAAVDNQCIPILGKLHAEQAHRSGPGVGKVCIVQIPVCVRSKIDCQSGHISL